MSFAILICALVLIACIISNKFFKQNRRSVAAFVHHPWNTPWGPTDFGIEFSDFSPSRAGLLRRPHLHHVLRRLRHQLEDRKACRCPIGVALDVGVVVTSEYWRDFFCHLVLKTSLLEGLLIGSVIGSTDAASVFSILRSKTQFKAQPGLAPRDRKGATIPPLI